MVFDRVLELAVGNEPVGYRDLVAQSKSKKVQACAARRPRKPADPGPAASGTPMANG
jgi:hypothetical protein